MTFQDKLEAVALLLMIRSGQAITSNHYDSLVILRDARMIEYDSLTDKGWSIANRLANEFGESL